MKTETTSNEPFTGVSGSVHFGYLVWCDCGHYYEPEGTVWFDHEPQIGELVRLGDGRDWTIQRVSHDRLELWSTLETSAQNE